MWLQAKVNWKNSHRDLVTCVVWPGAWGNFLKSHGYPRQSRPEASYYRLKSRFLIAGHIRRRLPDFGVTASRVVIIKYTGPTSGKFFTLFQQLLEKTKTKNIPRSSRFSVEFPPPVAIPVGELCIYREAWGKPAAATALLGVMQCWGVTCYM